MYYNKIMKYYNHRTINVRDRLFLNTLVNQYHKDHYYTNSSVLQVMLVTISVADPEQDPAEPDLFGRIRI
jgi:hypothetical protein